MTYTRINPDSGIREFSTCKTIKTSSGQWISNPSAEQIAAEGWVEYIPPVIPPAPQTEPSEYDKVVALNKMLASDIVALDDESALQVIALFPTWVEYIGKTLNVGERYYYDNRLWKVIQSHTAQADWTPNATPALYTEVSIEEFPEWRQPLGSEDAYKNGDKVSHNGKHWVSTMDANVYEPGVYGWSEVE